MEPYERPLGSGRCPIQKIVQLQVVFGGALFPDIEVVRALAEHHSFSRNTKLSKIPVPYRLKVQKCKKKKTSFIICQFILKIKENSSTNKRNDFFPYPRPPDLRSSQHLGRLRDRTRPAVSKAFLPSCQFLFLRNPNKWPGPKFAFDHFDLATDHGHDPSSASLSFCFSGWRGGRAVKSASFVSSERSRFIQDVTA